MSTIGQEPTQPSLFGEEPLPQNPPAAIAEDQTPHSGIHGFEKPVETFDKTTLPEAVAEGRLRMPDTVASIAPSSENTPWLTTRRKVIAFVAAVAALGGGIAAFAAVGSSSGSSDRTRETTVSAPPSPEVDPSVASNPDSLNTFFNKEMSFYYLFHGGVGPASISTEQMKENADAIWPYFTAAAQARIGSLSAWEQRVITKSPYLQTGYRPKLTNPTDVTAAAKSHNDVDAVNLTVGTDTGYSITVSETYDRSTGRWAIENFLTEGTTAPVSPDQMNP